MVLLKQKVIDLISHFEKTREDNRRLRSENEKLRYELEAGTVKLRELEREYDRLKLSGAILGDGEHSQEAKKRINNLVREIDNCIALLNNI
ncbi:MAG: hypothetical protein R2744_00355 [Bacteroidales bacterium]